MLRPRVLAFAALALVVLVLAGDTLAPAARGHGPGKGIDRDDDDEKEDTDDHDEDDEREERDWRDWRDWNEARNGHGKGKGEERDRDRDDDDDGEFAIRGGFPDGVPAAKEPRRGRPDADPGTTAPEAPTSDHRTPDAGSGWDLPPSLYWRPPSSVFGLPPGVGVAILLVGLAGVAGFGVNAVGKRLTRTSRDD